MWLLPSNGTFTIFYDISALPQQYHESLIEIEELPEGTGILRQAEDGSFYYEPIEPEPMESEPQPETIGQKLERLEQQLVTQQQQNLILLDVNMTIYEELLAVQERLNNA